MESKKEGNASCLTPINSWNKNKKGMSAVISNLLIILLVIVAVGIIWVVIQNLISDSTSDNPMQELNINMNIESVDFSSDTISVKVMNSGKEPVTGVIFIIETETDSDRYERKVAMNSKQTMTFDINYNGNMSKIQKISIAPFFETEDDEYTEGNIVDEYEVKDSDLWGITEGTTDDGGEEDDGGDTTKQCEDVSECGGQNVDDPHAKCNSSNMCECDDGWGNCDTYWDDGCQFNLTTNVLHCGECGNECQVEKCYYDPICEDGECDTELNSNSSCEGDSTDGCCPEYCSDNPDNETSYDKDCGAVECVDGDDCGENAECTDNTCSCIDPWLDCNDDGNCTCDSTTSSCQNEECVYQLDLTSLGVIRDGDNGAELSGASDVYVSGDYAYIVSSGSDALEVVNVLDPTNPSHESNLLDGDGSSPYLDMPKSVFVSEGHAYIASYSDNTLEVVDVSDPLNPLHKGSISNNDGGAVLEFPNSVYVSGDYAYLTNYYGNSLEIINVSDPSSPSHVTNIPNGGGSSPYLDRPTSVYVDGNYAYVTSENSNALQIIDISNPASPNSEGSIKNEEDGASLESPRDVHVLDNYAYVASFGADGLEIIDISSKSSPSHTKTFSEDEASQEPLRSPDSVFVKHYDFLSRTFAFVSTSNDMLFLIEVSSPSSPSLIDSEPVLGGPHSIFVEGNNSYITHERGDALEIVGIA